MADLSELLPRVKYELVGQIVTTVLGAALIFLLARLLGPEQYGLLFLVISILAFGRILGGAGVANSGARYIAKYKESEPSQISHILRISFCYTLVTILGAVVVLVIGHQYIASLFHGAEIVPLLLYGVFFVIFGTLTTYVRVILQGFERIRFSSIFHVLTIMSRFIFVIGLVLLGYGAWGALTGYIISFILISVFGLVFLYLKIYQKWKVDDSVDRKIRRRIAEYTIPLTVTNTADALNIHIDTILLGLFLNPLSVGFYVLAKQISQFLETPVYALGFSLAPTYGTEKAQNNIDRASIIYQNSLIYSLLFYIPASAGLVLVSDPAIRYLFGQEYLGAVPVLQIFAVYVVFRALTTITEDSLDYLGRARSRAIIKIPTVGLNIVLNIILIPHIGIVGAAIATIISYGLFTIAVMYIINIELDLQLRYIYKRILYIMLISVLMCAVVLFGVQFITNVFTLFIIILLGFFAWLILSIAFGLLDVNKFNSLIQ